jgi:hypothetical protein
MIVDASKGGIARVEPLVAMLTGPFFLLRSSPSPFRPARDIGEHASFSASFFQGSSSSS